MKKYPEGSTKSSILLFVHYSMLKSSVSLLVRHMFVVESFEMFRNQGRVSVVRYVETGGSKSFVSNYLCTFLYLDGPPKIIYPFPQTSHRICPRATHLHCIWWLRHIFLGDIASNQPKSRSFFHSRILVDAPSIRLFSGKEAILHDHGLVIAR